MSRLQTEGSVRLQTPASTSGRIKIECDINHLHLAIPPQRAVRVEVITLNLPSYNYVICFHASYSCLRTVNQAHYECLTAAKQLSSREKL